VTASRDPVVVETGTTAKPFRHRQTKGAKTDTLSLTPTAPHSYFTVKPLRREGRRLPPNLYARVQIFVASIARETAGAARTRSSLRPLFSRARFLKLRAQRTARIISAVIARLDRATRYSSGASD